MVSSIVSVRVKNRREEASDVQKVLTKYGCIINLRVGLHEIEGQCSDEGMILLHIFGDKKETDELMKSLKAIKGVKTDSMELK